MSFRGIRGQDRAVTYLTKSLASGRLGHAYIFYGPRGVGKRLSAINFAKAVNCLAPASDGPCDACIQCRKIDGANHPDVCTLAPKKEGSSIGIDEIRGLIKDIGLRAYEAKKKVYIVDGANAMTEEASNSLLKTLEEPPSDSIIILIAESLSALLPTIVSRAQAVKFFPLAPAEVKEILINTYGIDEVKAHVLAHISSGRIGEAIRFNEDEDFYRTRKTMLDTLARKSFAESEFDRLPKAELKACLDIMLTWYRDILLVKAGGPGKVEIINIDRRDEIKAAAGTAGFDTLTGIIRQIALTSSYLDQNANPKIALGALALAL